MVYQLVILDDVAQDILEAATWYHTKNPTLAEQLLLNIEAAYDCIISMPLVYATVYGSYRKVMLHKFPYAIYYLVEGEQIFIHAMIHQAKNPKTWQERLAQT